MFFGGSLMKTGVGAGLLFISPLGKHLCYVLRLHFPASNNVAEYEALVNRLRIAIELGVRRLDARGDSQLVIDQVMKNSHYRDQKMEAYCDEVRCLGDKFYGLEVNHVARWYNETADELAKIASARTTVPPDVFSRDLHQSSVKTDDTLEPEKVSALPEVPLAQPEAPSAHRQKVPGLLRGSPHPGGLGRRGTPHDEWTGRTCQRHDSARTQAEDLQRPPQVRQAMDEGTPLGGLEPEDGAKSSHGFHAVLSSLWSRGHLAHRLRIRFPKDEGLR
jgi:ribonuclease HI